MITEHIHNAVKDDFNALTSLLITSKSLYDEQENVWRGMDFLINAITRSCNQLAQSNTLENIYFLSLVREVSALSAFIYACDCCGKSDNDLDKARENALSFGSWRAFDHEQSDEYFALFTSMLRQYIDENSDLFA